MARVCGICTDSWFLGENNGDYMQLFEPKRFPTTSITRNHELADDVDLEGNLRCIYANSAKFWREAAQLLLDLVHASKNVEKECCEGYLLAGAKKTSNLSNLPNRPKSQKLPIELQNLIHDESIFQKDAEVQLWRERFNSVTTIETRALIDQVDELKDTVRIMIKAKEALLSVIKDLSNPLREETVWKNREIDNLKEKLKDLENITGKLDAERLDRITTQAKCDMEISQLRVKVIDLTRENKDMKLYGVVVVSEYCGCIGSVAL
ncbi:hypothetical protein NUW58_g8409 [Xylaria curta]|uniref:Uncharacterized protein n=1 Tax=Xylaria curta TaxID=42375 RepID=A0ACC1N9Y7_9PEZI|nr:hypothetical protein NUW58_g8409 [Xylaria curta]